MVRRQRGDAEFRTLVRELMHAGWYQNGQRCCPGGIEWGFRAGHTVDISTSDERWITAADAKDAMRILRADLGTGDPDGNRG